MQHFLENHGTEIVSCTIPKCQNNNQQAKIILFNQYTIKQILTA